MWVYLCMYVGGRLGNLFPSGLIFSHVSHEGSYYLQRELASGHIFKHRFRLLEGVCHVQVLLCFNHYLIIQYCMSFKSDSAFNIAIKRF